MLNESYDMCDSTPWTFLERKKIPVCKMYFLHITFTFSAFIKIDGTTFLKFQTGRSRGFGFVYFEDVEDAADVS